MSRIPDEPIKVLYRGKVDDEFLEDIKRALMTASVVIQKFHKKGFAEKMMFNGKLGHQILQGIKDRKWNFDSQMLKGPDHMPPSIIVSLGRKITTQEQMGHDRGNSLDGLIVPGLVTGIPAGMMGDSNGIIIERDENPEVTVLIQMKP